MESTELNPFKKAGITLLIIGLIDIGVFIYCINNAIAYSSSFNIFAVIAGIFLLRGGVKTARLVRFFSIFFITGSIGLVIVYPFLYPSDLLLLQLKLYTSSFLFGALFAIALTVFLIWLFKQLSTPESLSILSNSGYNTDFPKKAVAAGVGLIIFLTVMLSISFSGESAKIAKQLAQEQTGPGYKYHISNMSMSGNSGRANVIAYKDNEITNVQVQW